MITLLDEAARSGYWRRSAAGSRSPGIRGRTKGQYWVRFSVIRVVSTPDRPHGLNYSLTLHGPGGNRLVGFDNAHPVRESHGPGGKSRGPVDHKHRMETVRPYRFKDAAMLLEDFWAEVDKLLKEKGVI